MLITNKNESLDRVQTERHLIFQWNKSNFAVSINYVKEVMEYTNPTPLPNYPNLLCGIISFRGEICPVLDLRSIFPKDMNKTIQPSKLIVIQLQGFKAAFDVDKLCGVHNIFVDETHLLTNQDILTITFKSEQYEGSIVNIPNLWTLLTKLIQR
tara:strand:+ start:3046 stop:3507 length:462 start_codon:yes stop_codon:yes gene_type:complete